MCGLGNFRSLSGVPTLNPHEIFRFVRKLSPSIANESQFYPLPDLPGSMRFYPEPKKLLALEIGPDPYFRHFSSWDFEIFVEIGVFTIFRGPQHFSFTFPQRTWMGKVLGDSPPQLSIRVGSNWDNRATLVFAPENARK